MKGFICMVAILCLMIVSDSAFARGSANTRAKLNMKWKKIEAWQKRQDQQFMKIERDAARSFRQMRGEDESIDSIPYPGWRTCP